MKHLISFLTLLVLGWGSAWADVTQVTYPKTWDFESFTTVLSGGWTHNGTMNSINNAVYAFEPSTTGEIVTGKGRDVAGTVVSEFAGLVWNTGGANRMQLYTDGTGAKMYSTTVTIPGLMYGNVVTFTMGTCGHPGNTSITYSINGTTYTINRAGTNGTSEGDRADKIVTIPSDVTTPTDVTFTFNAYNSSEPLNLKKIEVTKTDATADWNYVRIGTSSSSYENYRSDFNNGACTLSADAVSYFSGRFQIKDPDGNRLNISKLVEGNTGNLGNYFEITSSDGTIIDVSNATFSVTSGDDYVMVGGLSFLSKGEATLTMTYKGSNAFGASSVTTVVTIEGVPTKLGLYNEGWDFSEIYIDNTATNIRKFLKLIKTSDDSDVNFDTTVPCTVVYDDEETTHCVTLGNVTYFDATRLDIYLTPNKLGTCTFVVTYPGDAVYEPAVYYFDMTVKQHIAELKWVDGNGDDVEKVTTTTTSGSLPDAPTLKAYKDYAEYTGYTLNFSSSDTGVATVDANGNVTIVGPGITVIQASLVPEKKVVDDISHYYYNEASDSYTLVVTNGSTSGTQPRIIWVTAVRYNWSSMYNNNGRGSYLGQKYCGSHGESVDYEAGYGNDVFVSALALKSTVTDADLATRGILPIPNSGYSDHYYVMDDPNNTYWNTGGWRACNSNCIPTDWLFDSTDPYQNNITYIISNPDGIRTSTDTPQIIEGTGDNGKPTSIFKFTPAYPDKEPLYVYAYVKGYDAYSQTPVLVTPGNLQLRFVPDHNTVNAGQSIMPYVNCPDLRMEDVNKIYLTWECPTILNIPNDGVVYETGKTSTADIAKYLDIVTSNDTIWVNSQNHAYGIKEIKAVTWLRGIKPEIWGLATGIDQSCTVTLHLESEMYETATADYTLTVLDKDAGPMFHWEMNDIVAGGKHMDDGVVKTIKMVQGDFIYMPGIVGNANGNTQYSQPNTYKYMYGMKNGKIIMNYKGYFPGEGIPNYYVSYTDNGEPSVPETNTTTTQPAIISWAIGLGDYWRYDSLMVYGNQPGEMYLCAQDAQTGQNCTAIKLVVLSRESLLDAKSHTLDHMSYPFTWDFENLDMTEIVKDAKDGTDGNGGTYWRKAWDDDYDQSNVDKAYNRDYRHETSLYQYNGGMNADWDDKDGNSTSRQRWFKDIYANGEYMPEFKGMMLNLAGLDYWEQKYQRFEIDKDGKFIRFVGGPIFVQLPGFGLLQKKGGTEDGTRSYDNYIGSTHNHINTAKYNVNEGYTKMLSVTNENNKNVSYPVQEKYRNNKVRFVIKALGRRNVFSTDETPNENGSSQFHIGGASMLNEALNVNDINWTQGVHNGYSYYNLTTEPKVYIVELDPYDPELQDHIYLMFNNDVDVYWMAITNEPRNILSDFDGVTYSYPKDIDMTKTNQTIGQQTKEGIYTKATSDGKYALASVGEYTIKNQFQVGSTTAGAGTEVQLKAYKVASFDPSNQSVSLEEIEGNIPKNEGVMLYTEPRMSALASNPVGLEPAWYDRGNTAWSEWVTKEKTVDGKTVTYEEEVFHVALASDSTASGNIYNNSHNYYYFPLYFIAMAENMSDENYAAKAPESTGTAADPTISSGHVTTGNLLRPVTYGQILSMDYTYGDTKLINFGYNNEFICRQLVYQDGTQTKTMDAPYVDGSGSNAHEGMYYYKIGPECAKFYRINTAGLNHHNRSAYMTLTWDEYKVNTVGKPINMSSSSTQDNPESNGVGSATFQSPIRFSPSYNPVDIRFDVQAVNEQVVSEDGGFVDGINEVEHASTESEGVYNLNGVRVNNLSKGIYVINGKKVVVK